MSSFQVCLASRPPIRELHTDPVDLQELALSGYPFHIWLKPYHEQLPYIEDFYTKAAVEADGLEMRALQATCVAHRIRAVIGFSERDGGSLFMSQWLIGPDGDVVVRRKLKPTSLERIVYGEGDVRVLVLVHLSVTLLTWAANRGPTFACMKRSWDESAFCSAGCVSPACSEGLPNFLLMFWLPYFANLPKQEHAQSILKYAMSSQHEELHCASWPVFPAQLPHHSLSQQGNSAILTAYAIETGTFVVSASSYFSQQNLDKLFGAQGGPLTVGSGWTTIIDPEGRTLATAEHDKTCVIYANIDLDACYKAKSVLDPLGHYARRDVFQYI